MSAERKRQAGAVEPVTERKGLGPPPPPSDALSLACKLVAETAERIASQLGTLLDRGDRQKVSRTFDRALLPRRTPGRKRKKSITAAFEDWKAGMRGTALYRKHIPRWDKHSNWRRRGEQRAFMDAIYSRQRRNKTDKNPPVCPPG